MTQLIDIKVPDISDFKDVPVIDIAVKAGDMITVYDSICTLESDKATMDVPSSAAGVVGEVVIKPGDKASQGSSNFQREVLLFQRRINHGGVTCRRARPLDCVLQLCPAYGSRLRFSCLVSARPV